MKIGLLATGITPDDLLPRFGSYAEMFSTQLKGHNASFEFETFDVRDGIFPANADVCDAWLITGSRSNVYEGLPWMLQLNELIREIDAKKQPLVGICFGHQIIADALGGKVDKFEGGWGVGVHKYDTIKGVSSFPDNLTSFSICVMHQDQVVTKPARAKVFAYSDFCENAGLVYDQHVVTFQGHPEFDKAYETVLLDTLKDVSFSLEVAEEGYETVEQEKLDSPEVMTWIADFMVSAHQARLLTA